MINLVPHSYIEQEGLHGPSSSQQISFMDLGFSVGPSTVSGWMRHLCGGFLSDVSSLLCCVLGRRLKGAAHSKNGEDEHLPTVWRPGEPEERAGNKEGILELGSARNHCKN